MKSLKGTFDSPTSVKNQLIKLGIIMYFYINIFRLSVIESILLFFYCQII